MNGKALAAVFAIGILAGCRNPAAEQKPITVAATADVAATGLPQLLIKRFTGEAHVNAGFIATTDEEVVRGGQAGKIDVAIVSSPEVLRALRQTNSVTLEAMFAYDDYIIAGPKKDPAGVRASKTAAEAFRKIVRRRHRFCSPVDVKALHERENEIWSLARVNPKQQAKYALCHGPAAASLDEAERLEAYTITDRATIESNNTGSLGPLLEGTPMLHNDYSVVLLVPPAKNRNAEWFVQWLMSYRGREAVEGYRFEGGRRFFLAEGK